MGCDVEQHGRPLSFPEYGQRIVSACVYLSTLAEVPTPELEVLCLQEFHVYHNSVASQVKMKVSTFCQYINIFYISGFNAFEATEI